MFYLKQIRPVYLQSAQLPEMFLPFREDQHVSVKILNMASSHLNKFLFHFTITIIVVPTAYH